MNIKNIFSLLVIITINNGYGAAENIFGKRLSLKEENAVRLELGKPTLEEVLQKELPTLRKDCKDAKNYLSCINKLKPLLEALVQENIDYTQKSLALGAIRQYIKKNRIPVYHTHSLKNLEIFTWKGLEKNPLYKIISFNLYIRHASILLQEINQENYDVKKSIEHYEYTINIANGTNTEIEQKLSCFRSLFGRK